MKKPTRVWIVLIVAPFILLLVVSILEIFVQFTLNKTEVPTPELTAQSALCNGTSTRGDLSGGNCDGTEGQSTNTFKVIIRIIQMLLGIVGTIGVMLEPLWITLYVMARQSNKNQASI